MERIGVGDIVKWSTSRKPIGTVVHTFTHRLQKYAVVEVSMKSLRVVRIYEKLIKC